MDQVTARALRALSIDLANTAQQVAWLRAGVETMQEMAGMLDAASWTYDDAPNDETGDPPTNTVTLSANQAYLVREILTTLGSLS